MLLEKKKRYLQIAFNADLWQAQQLLPSIPYDPRIFIEAGTPFIKREGTAGIRLISSTWPGVVVADLKVTDGAAGEVKIAREAGASAMTCMGSAPIETINLFIRTCKQHKAISMIDMLGVVEPHRVLLKLKQPPDVVVLHKGRDEESTRGKVIQYKHVNKIRSKYDVLISAAGGVDLKEARSAIFNGANIVVANIVSPEDPWTGIRSNEDVAKISQQFLATIA
ncbi:MAG: hypothetical protein JW782_01475 [Candidatus Saganbacteria bacterium]|nr:hypothetical protein [Candidatus Saganbacteria bacterium]